MNATNKHALDVRRACAIWTARELLQEAYAPIPPMATGAQAADLYTLHTQAMTALETYGDALWRAGIIAWADPTSTAAAHACRAVVRAIADESDPRAAGWRDERTYAAHLAREAAKPTARDS